MFTVDGHAHGAPRRDAHDLGARASRPRHGAAGTAPAPALILPRRGAGAVPAAVSYTHLTLPTIYSV